MTPNIEKVSLSSTDVSNDDIKTLVRRCNKIKELDISYTAIDIDVVVDEIFYICQTLWKSYVYHLLILQDSQSLTIVQYSNLVQCLDSGTSGVK